MADTSTSSNCKFNFKNGSPINNITQDQLFTILLLLPVDSILSFAQSCKRFRDLTCSDTLWENVCKRDWGPTSVGAFKPSNGHRNHVPWMELYKQLFQLKSVSCYKLCGSDCELNYPNPRASHSLNFVSDCLVLFGGGCEGGRHLDDTWVAYIGNDFQRKMRWQKVNSGVPSGRFGHTCVVIGNFLVLFGGINDNGNRQNDTWVGYITSHETLGVTLSWRLLDVGVTAPSPRGAHASCCIDSGKMVIHGGIGLGGLRLNDTWVLELSENLYFGTWYEIVTHPSPPARSGHTLTCIGEGRTVLFGGRGSGGDVLNDVWLLDSYQGHFKWVEIFYTMQQIPDGYSIPRVGHSATRIVGDRILVYGGEDSYRHRKDDFWLLDINAVLPVRLQPAKINSSNPAGSTATVKGLLAKMWKSLGANGYKPKCRSFHCASADTSGCFLYVFGGMVDGLLQPTEPTGLGFDEELFLVELAL